MHTCVNCAQNAMVGGEAISLCTKCGSLSGSVVDAGVTSTALIAALAVVGVSILSVQALKAVRSLHMQRVALG